MYCEFLSVLKIKNPGCPGYVCFVIIWYQQVHIGLQVQSVDIMVQIQVVA